MSGLPIWLRRRLYRVAHTLLGALSAVVRLRTRGVQCVLHDRGQVLLVRHTYGNRARWDLPGGFVRPREQPERAAAREMAEELGLTTLELRALGVVEAGDNRRRARLHCFAADIDRASVKLDRGELEQAEWFAPESLPQPLGEDVRVALALEDGPLRP